MATAFWEHLIQNENDFEKHVEYIHYNPVNHGLVLSVKDWAYSSFHKYVKDGIYDIDWGDGVKIRFYNVGKELG